MSKNSKRSKQRDSLKGLGSCIVALFVCLVFGGGTRTFEIGDVIAEALCLPVIVITALRMRDAPLDAMKKSALALAALMFLAPLLQLVPLPPDVWTRLPGRAFVAEAFRVSEVPLPWLGISLTPGATRQSAFSLLAPFAVLLAASRLGSFERRITLGALLGFGVASVMLGLMQIASGAGSPLRIYYPEDADAVGLFANRNHYAALLYVCLLIATSWWLADILELRNSEASRRRRSPWALSWLQAVVVGMLLLGIVISQSRAGLLLAIVAILLGLASVVPSALDRRAMKPVALGALVILVLLGATLNYALYDIWARITSAVGVGERTQIAASTRTLISETFPYGSGFGSFVPFYAARETIDTSIGAAVNRAHDDFLEWALEGGFISILVIAAGFAWLAWAFIRAWTPADNGTVVDRSLIRAVTFAPFLLLGHSLIDYPLRTVALMGVAALAVGVILGANARTAGATEVRDLQDRSGSTIC